MCSPSPVLLLPLHGILLKRGMTLCLASACGQGLCTLRNVVNVLVLGRHCQWLPSPWTGSQSSCYGQRCTSMPASTFMPPICWSGACPPNLGASHRGSPCPRALLLRPYGWPNNQPCLLHCSTLDFPHSHIFLRFPSCQSSPPDGQMPA